MIAQVYVGEDLTEVELDRVIQRPLRSSNEELFKHGVDIIQEKTSNLFNKLQQQVIELFTKYKSV